MPHPCIRVESARDPSVASMTHMSRRFLHHRRRAVESSACRKMLPLSWRKWFRKWRKWLGRMSVREIVNCALEGSVRMSKAEERVRGLRRGVCQRTADEKLVNESEKKSDTRNVRDEWMPARRVRAVDRSADAARGRFWASVTSDVVWASPFHTVVKRRGRSEFVLKFPLFNGSRKTAKYGCHLSSFHDSHHLLLTHNDSTLNTTKRADRPRAKALGRSPSLQAEVLRREATQKLDRFGLGVQRQAR